MYRIDRNDYTKNRKNSVVTTPDDLAKQIGNIVNYSLEYSNDLASSDNNSYPIDLCCNNGSLSKYIKSNVLGVDILDCKDAFQSSSFEKIYRRVFIKSSYQKLLEKIGRDYRPPFVITNPPFNRSHFGGKKVRLIPEDILRTIFEYFGKIPVIMIAPMGFRLNQRKTSSRLDWFKKEGISISSILTLPLDVFDNVLFHSEVLFFNFDSGCLLPHYWYGM